MNDEPRRDTQPGPAAGSGGGEASGGMGVSQRGARDGRRRPAAPATGPGHTGSPHRNSPEVFLCYLHFVKRHGN